MKAWAMNPPNARIRWLGNGSQVSSDDRKGCGLDYMSVEKLFCVCYPYPNMKLGAGVCKGGFLLSG